MTLKQIKDAAEKSVERGEGLQLWQAIEWLNDYGLIDYKHYRAFMEAQVQAQKAHNPV